MRSEIWKVVLFSAVSLIFVWIVSCAQTEAVRTSESASAGVNSAVNAVVADEKHPEVDYSISCFECHEDVSPEINEAWSKGKHGLVNVGCFICHGDGEVEFYAKPTDMACVSCHSNKEVDFATVEATSCYSCHGGHALTFHGI